MIELITFSQKCPELTDMSHSSVTALQRTAPGFNLHGLNYKQCTQFGNPERPVGTARPYQHPLPDLHFACAPFLHVYKHFLRLADDKCYIFIHVVVFFCGVGLAGYISCVMKV